MPAARLSTSGAVHKVLELSEEAVIPSVLIQQWVPESAHNAVVALERCPVVSSVGAPGDEKTPVLQEAHRVNTRLRCV